MKRLIIPVFMLLSIQVNAADMANKNCRVGEVAQLTGTVEVQRNKETITPTQGMKICRGDLFKRLQVQWLNSNYVMARN